MGRFGEKNTDTKIPKTFFKSNSLLEISSKALGATLFIAVPYPTLNRDFNTIKVMCITNEVLHKLISTCNDTEEAISRIFSFRFEGNCGSKLMIGFVGIYPYGQNPKEKKNAVVNSFSDLITVEVAIEKNLKSLFGESFTDFETAPGLIDGDAVGQFTEDGRILLSSDKYIEGTEYHEAFHRVWRRFLTDAQRDELIQEFIAANPKIKEILDLKRSEGYNGSDAVLVEEIFAEEFRMFMLVPEYYIKQNRGEKNKVEKKRMNFFQRLLALIKGFLGIKENYFDPEYAALNVQLSDNIIKLFEEINQGKFIGAVQSNEAIYGNANMFLNVKGIDNYAKNSKNVESVFYELDASQLNQVISSLAGLTINLLLPSIVTSLHENNNLGIKTAFEAAIRIYGKTLHAQRISAHDEAKSKYSLSAEEQSSPALYFSRNGGGYANMIIKYLGSYLTSSDEDRAKFEIDLFEEVKDEINKIVGIQTTKKAIPNNTSIGQEEDSTEDAENDSNVDVDSSENETEIDINDDGDVSANLEVSGRKESYVVQATIDPTTTVNQKIKLLLYGIYNSPAQLRTTNKNSANLFGLYNPKEFGQFLSALLNDLAGVPVELMSFKLQSLVHRKRSNYALFLKEVKNFFFEDNTVDENVRASFLQSFSNFEYTYMITAIDGKNIYPVNENKNTTRELIRTKIKNKIIADVEKAKNKDDLLNLFDYGLKKKQAMAQAVEEQKQGKPEKALNVFILHNIVNQLNLNIAVHSIESITSENLNALGSSMREFFIHVHDIIYKELTVELAKTKLYRIFQTNDGGMSDGVSGRIDTIANAIDPLYERVINMVKGPEGKTYYSISQYTYQTMIVSRLRAFNGFKDSELNDLIESPKTKEKLEVYARLKNKDVEKVKEEIVSEVQYLLEHFREGTKSAIDNANLVPTNQSREGKKLYLLYLYFPELLDNKTKFSNYFRRILFEKKFIYGTLNHAKNMETSETIETAKLNTTDAFVQTIINELNGIHRVVQHADRSTIYTIETTKNIISDSYERSYKNKKYKSNNEAVFSYYETSEKDRFIRLILPIMQQEFSTNLLPNKSAIQGAGVNGYEKNNTTNNESVFDEFLSNVPLGMFHGGIKVAIAKADLQDRESIEYKEIVSTISNNIDIKIKEFADVLVEYGILEKVTNPETNEEKFISAISSEVFGDNAMNKIISIKQIENIWLTKTFGHIEEMLLFLGDPRVYSNAINAFKRFNLQSSTGKADVSSASGKDLKKMHDNAATIVKNSNSRTKISYGNKTAAKYDGSAREVIGTEEKRRSTSVDFVRETAEIHYKNILERENEANLFRYRETQVKRYIANELEDELKKLTKEFEKTNTFKDALDGEKATNKFFKLEIHGRTVRTKVLNEFKREKRGELIKKFRDNFIFTKRNGKIVSVKNTRTGEVKNVKWSNSDIEKKAVKHGAKQAKQYESMVIDDGQSWLNIYSYTTFKDKQGAWTVGNQLTLEFELFVYADAIKAIDEDKAEYTSLELLAREFIEEKGLVKNDKGTTRYLTTDELMRKLEPLTPEKSKYVGNSYANRDEWMISAIDEREAVISVRKHAYDVLMPTILRGATPATRSKQFDKMRFMIDHGIDFYHTESGAKSGVRKTHKWHEEIEENIMDITTGEIETIKYLGNFNSAGLLIKDESGNATDTFDISYESYLDWAYVQEQLEIDSKEKVKIIDSVQKRKNILGDIEVNGVPIDFYLSEEEEKNGNLFDIWNSLEEEDKKLRSNLYAAKEQFLDHTNSLMAILVRDLKLLLGFAEDSSGRLVLQNMQDMVNVIKEKAINKSSASNILDSIDNLINTNAIEALPNAHAIEPILLSIITNNIINIHRPGNAVVQISSLGMEPINTRLHLADNGKYLANTDNEFYSDTEEINPNIRPAQVKMSVPLKWRKKFIDFANKMEGTGGHTLLTAIEFVNKYIEQRLSEGKDAITLIGLRIPNQQLSSNNVFSVIKFYPPTKANFIYVSSEVVAKEGSGFSIDKQQLYFDTELLEQENILENDYEQWKQENKNRVDRVEQIKKSSDELDIFKKIKPFSKHAYNNLMELKEIPSRTLKRKGKKKTVISGVPLETEVKNLQILYKDKSSVLLKSFSKPLKSIAKLIDNPSINDAIRNLLRSTSKNGEAKKITKIIKQYQDVITLLLNAKKELGNTQENEVILDNYNKLHNMLKANIYALENLLVTTLIENQEMINFLTAEQAEEMDEIEQEQGETLHNLYTKITQENAEIEAKNEQALEEREDQFRKLYATEKRALQLENISQAYHLHKLFEAEKNLILNKHNAGQLLAPISIANTDEIYEKLPVAKSGIQKRNKRLSRIINPAENILNNEVMNHAKFNVGIAAVNQSLQRILHQLNISVRDRYTGNSYRNFTQRTISNYIFIGDIGDSLSIANLIDEDGNFISTTNSEVITLQVDNVKTLKSTNLNLKTETMTIAQYLIARGVGYEAVVKFLTSPIILRDCLKIKNWHASPKN